MHDYQRYGISFSVTATLVTRKGGYGNGIVTNMNRKSNKDITVTARYLADKGYTITRAAQNVGCSPAHLTHVLKGDRQPSATLQERLRALPRLMPVMCRVNY